MLEDRALLQSRPGRKLDLYHSKGFQDPEFMTDQGLGELVQRGTIQGLLEEGQKEQPG